jgi:hypothetical protein
MDPWIFLNFLPMGQHYPWKNLKTIGSCTDCEHSFDFKDLQKNYHLVAQTHTVHKKYSVADLDPGSRMGT